LQVERYGISEADHALALAAGWTPRKNCYAAEYTTILEAIGVCTVDAVLRAQDASMVEDWRDDVREIHANPGMAGD
jgi:hypothetical protein